jgi:hypothetical protein
MKTMTRNADSFPSASTLVITILRGSFFRNQEIAVLSGRIDLRPPKIIVGISLTLLDEKSAFPQGVVTLPAILDTGFNRTLEIDEGHLVRWAGLRKEHLELAAKDRSHEGRKYDLYEANIWLHRTPYTGPRTPPAQSPLLLENSRQVRVMAPMGKPNPRLPLLGLMALIKNNVQVLIDGEHSRFRIEKSLRSSVSELYRKFFT